MPIVLALLMSVVNVTGGTTCPAPDDVARHLAGLIATSADGGRHEARVSRNGSTVRIELVDDAGALLALRDFHDDGTCADAAKAAAIIVASWETDLDPRVALSVRLPPAARPPQRTAPVAVAAAADTPPPSRGFGVMGRLGLVTSEAGGDVVFGGRAESSLFPAGPRFSVDASLFGTMARSQSVGTTPDAAEWQRWAVALGPAYTFRPGYRLRPSIRVQAVGARLRVAGKNVPNPAADTAWQAGFALGTQLAWGTGLWAPWAGADLVVWGGDDQLVIRNLTQRAELPRTEVQFSVGLRLGRFP